LVYGLSKLYPNFTVERRGGPSEIAHGTDILIRIPGIIDDNDYGIAIQVADYTGKIDATIKTNQIKKADDYWLCEGIKIIDKYIIFTKVNKEDSINTLEDGSVKYIFSNQLKDLLTKIGKVIIGLKNE
jgi:hypothetical protein